MQISQAGLDLIKKFEGFEPEAYLCPAGIWTIGYGHTGDVAEGQTITEEEAEELLRHDVAFAEDAVTDYVEGDLTQGQFDALVCFVFNIGAGAFRDSTLLRLLNQGDSEGAAEQFLRWNKAGGKVLAGLTRRREAERELFLS